METRSTGDNHKTVIAIPIYKTELSPDEMRSLQQVFRILGHYDITAVIPESIGIGHLSARFPKLGSEYFSDSWFQGIRAYNSLVLDESFYKRFKGYDYMLIYQLDAYVFSDEVGYWARQGYDYIGAPWIPTDDKYLTPYGRLQIRLKHIFRKSNGRDTHMTHLYGIGNGGFSLRKIDRFIELTHHYKDKIVSDLSSGEGLYPEDLWLFYEPEGKYRLRKPAWKDALNFAFEQNPEKSYIINGGRLPFGCHAWSHPAYREFWKGFIK